MALEESAKASVAFPTHRPAMLLGPDELVRAAVLGLRGKENAPKPFCLVGGPSLADASRELGLPLVDSLLQASRLLGEASEAAFVAAVGAVRPRARALSLLEQASQLGWRIHHLDCAGEDPRWRPWDLADVLGDRSDVRAEPDVRRLISGRRILVTGAGGSIGSALCREIAAMGPAWIGLLDHSEYNLFRIDYDLKVEAPGVARSVRLCDVRDNESLRRWFDMDQPDLVFHAAALKHVPLVEAHPSEGVITNVAGTRNVARAARAVGADLVFVSTDKAVNPANVMGATKRLGELFCQALDRGSAPRVVTVRLGNVLGSAGSVSPLFASQIAAGGPVTVTHRGVMRYFITIPQTAAFLLRAAALGFGREDLRGVVNVLEMGEPMAVVDLARTMIRLAGRRPDVDIPITFVGLRPGEKLSEQLVADEEWVAGAMSPDVTAVASPARDLATLESDIDRLVALARSGRDDLVRAQLSAALAAPLPERAPLRSAVAV